ncbi:MAG TPA: hypothetical protein VM580_20235 [Labilithrix sp.]|nr:hypothetical protein [Labilithrix sp.]
MRPKVLVSWSSGKDAAWALHVLRRQATVDIVGLVSVVSRGDDRVAMHAVRERLLEAQAERAGLPLWKAPIPDPCSAEQYAAAMSRVVDEARAAGVTQFAFGDLYLEDVRAAREQKLASTGLRPIFPIWGRPPAELAREMVSAGLRAKLVSIDPRRLDRSFAGRTYDDGLLDALPADVDPCGERGEFHTFVHDGPMFSAPIHVANGAVTERDGYVYADLLPA